MYGTTFKKSTYIMQTNSKISSQRQLSFTNIFVMFKMKFVLGYEINALQATVQKCTFDIMFNFIFP